MKKFICQLSIFMIPFGIILVVYCFFMRVGYVTGEFRDFDTLIQEQREDHSIFIGMGYNEQTAYYKLTNANYYQPDVIALGTSRVMQFKNEYFSRSFYNCGGAVGENYDEYLNFLKNLVYNPKVIMLGLDEWVFNDTWNHYRPLYSDYVSIALLERNKLVMTNDIIKDFIIGKWSFNEINNYDMNYGFNGRIKDKGFCWDGSYFYGDVYRNPELQEDYLLADTFSRIDGGYGGFEWAEHIDDETFEYLEVFLKYCKDNDIEVIGFAPPFAPSVYNKMIESGNYGYLTEIDPLCEQLFAKYSYEYYSYVCGDVLGTDDSYYIDGFHGSEVVYANIIKDMLNHHSSIREYINEDVLDALLEDPYSNLLLEEFEHEAQDE